MPRGVTGLEPVVCWSGANCINQTMLYTQLRAHFGLKVIILLLFLLNKSIMPFSGKRKELDSNQHQLFKTTVFFI